jgi:hypothetical protein
MQAIVNPTPGCGVFGTAQTVTVRILNNGCTVFPAGASIPVSFSETTTGTNASENLVLTAPLAQGQTVNYTFTTTVNMSALGNYTFSATVSAAGDGTAANNTLAGVLVIHNPLSTALPYCENFENPTPGLCWTRTNSPNFAGTTAGFQYGTALGSAFFAIPAATRYAASNDDSGTFCGPSSPGCNMRNDFLISPKLNLSGHNNAVVTFDYVFPATNYGSSAFVKVSTDNVNWTTLFDFAAAAQNNAWQTRTINLTSYAGQPQVWVAFHHDDNAQWGTGLAVDNACFSDPTPPNLITLSPTHTATGVPVDANLVMTFDEFMALGAAGTITISDGTTNIVIPISSAEITISGNTVTINPTANLLPSTTYTVTVTSGAFTDQSGNAFAGITAGSWVFTTAASGCAITAITAGTATACVPATNTYTRQVTITYSNAPATGNLVVNGQSFPITTSPQTVTLTGLTANGLPVTVTANFSANPLCTFTVNNLFTAPASCAPPTTITTGPITPLVYCAGQTISVPFTTTGTFNAGNVFTAQLSNAAGSFAAPIATNTGTSPITLTIPGGATTSSNYKVRVIASNPATTGTEVTITINANVTPSVSVTASPAGAICAGQNVTFTATPTNGGTTPAYQWQVNGTNVPGATSSTFSSTALANGDQVSVILTSSATCVTTATATSTAITMTVNPAVTPSVTASASQTTICAGQSVTFTATPTNGGAAPTYQWQINGTNVPGATSATFTTTSLSAGSPVITVVMTSNAACASPTSVTSAGITMTVNPSVTPSVSVTASPSGAICAGTSVTFTATPTNGGAAPTYQWQINGTNVPGETGSTFTSSTLTNGQVVTVVMTSNATCPVPASATSAGITMTVNPVLTPSVSISASTTSVCVGGSITFTATPTNGGTTPTYQWQVNGVNVAGATASTFTSSTLNNGDVVTVVLTSNATCVSPTTATSAGTTVSVAASVTPSVSITASPSGAICAGTSVTFTATPTNGGTTPTYQWQINGVNVSGATGATFTSSTLTNGQVVTVVMTSSAGCASPTTATSAGTTMTVNPLITPSVSVTAGTAMPVCVGTAVTYTANPTNGGAAPTYQWFVNGVLQAGATSNTFTFNAAAGQSISVQMTSNATCPSPATVSSAPFSVTTINVPPMPFAANQTGCVGGTIPNLTATGTGTNTVNWYSDSGLTTLVHTGASFNTGMTAAGVYTYYVTQSNACGASAPRTVTLTINAVCATGVAPPNPPAYLIVEARDASTLRLRFPDMASDEDGYEIYRSLDGSNFTFLTLTAPYATAECIYFDEGLLEDTPYYYIVRTKRGSTRSGFTNSAYDYTYPNAPTLLSVTDACVASTGRIDVKGTHNTGRFRWYNNATDPSTQGFKGSDGSFYENAFYITPNIQEARTYYVTTRGHKYESQTRLAVTVGIKPLPSAVLTTPARVRACENNFTLTAEAVAGATYRWYNNGVLVGTTTTNSFTATASGMYNVSVEVNGCSKASTFAEVRLNYRPLANILNGTSTFFCKSGVLTAEAVEGASYEWKKDGATVGTTRSVTVNASGTYQLNVTESGCTATREINVSVYTFPALNLSASETGLCPGGISELTVNEISGATKYEWIQDGRVVRVTNRPTFRTSRAGEYRVRVFVGDDCSELTSAIVIEALEAPTASLNFEGGAMSIVTSGTVSGVKWFVNGEEKPALANRLSVTPSENGRYIAVVTYTSGCEVSTNSTFYVLGTETEEDKAVENGLMFYPNPASKEVFVKLNGLPSGSVEITDNLGRTLETVKFAGVSEVKLNISEFPVGTYFVKVSTSEFTVVRKLVKE